MAIDTHVRRRFRVGLFVLVALVFVMFGVLMVGDRANLFRRKFPYRTKFASAAGLVAGNAVRLDGVTVGNVQNVHLSSDPADRTVMVVFDVIRSAAPRIRTGTRASIKTVGLLGDKYIELEGGTADEKLVPVDGEVPAKEGAGLDKLLEGSGDLLVDLSEIARSLKAILQRTERGEGFLGALTSASPESGRLGNDLHATLSTLNSILKKVDQGEGLVGKLVADKRYARETSESLRGAFQSLQGVLGRIEQGLSSNDGAVPALLSDPEGKKKVYALLDSLTTASISLTKVTEEMREGKGLLPILLNDPRFGKEFSENLRSFSGHLDSISRKLDEGQGTAGKLINDPAIFDAANRLVVGVDESWLLSWLVKDRQKAGIKKEYEDYVRALTATPTPSPALTPAVASGNGSR
jgi:phospholipid/cholesterol/gamma-HCH transport system substrate-binding protein